MTLVKLNVIILLDCVKFANVIQIHFHLTRGSMSRGILYLVKTLFAEENILMELKEDTIVQSGVYRIGYTLL